MSTRRSANDTMSLARTAVYGGVVGFEGSTVFVEQIVTSLEMTSPGQLRPAEPVAGLDLVRVEDPAGSDADQIRHLHDAIGRPHHWSSLRWPAERFRRWLETSGQHHWYITVDDVPVGWACLQVNGEGGVEIADFGLIPDAIGKGFGAAALTELIRIAWKLPNEDEAEALARRVWLRTTSFDHPHALANYRARGFEIYDVHVRQRELNDALP